MKNSISLAEFEANNICLTETQMDDAEGGFLFVMVVMSATSSFWSLSVSASFAWAFGATVSAATFTAYPSNRDLIADQINLSTSFWGDVWHNISFPSTSEIIGSANRLIHGTGGGGGENPMNDD